MKNFILALSTVAFMAACGSQSGSNLASAPGTQKIQSFPVVIQSFSTEPTNGGINPDARGVKILATILAGSNPCFAAQNNYRLDQVHKNGAVHIVAMGTPKSLEPRYCTMQYQPVYLTLETRAISLTGQFNLVVENVHAMGQNEKVNL